MSVPLPLWKKKRSIYVCKWAVLKVLMNLRQHWTSSNKCQVATALFSYLLRSISWLDHGNCFSYLTSTLFSDCISLCVWFPTFFLSASILFSWCFFRINKSLWQAGAWLILIRKLCFFRTLDLFFHFCFQVPKQYAFSRKQICFRKITVFLVAQVPWRCRLR